MVRLVFTVDISLLYVLDPMSLENLMIFSGNANRDLASGVCAQLGLRLGNAKVGRFADGEIMVEVNENVRGRDVFVLQSSCAPTNDHLMEILVLVDALKRSSAGRITAAIPYFGYARQDRRPRSARVPISAKLVANLLQVAGVDRVVTVDLHADQIQGFFDIPVDNIYATPALIADVLQRYAGVRSQLMVVSPDVGGVVRARAFAKRLGCDLAIIDKRRAKANESEVMNLIGDVSGKVCILVDDLVDTAGTLCKAAAALKEQGAVSVSAYATHPVFSADAVGRITLSPLDEIVVTDTIPLTEQAKNCSKIRQVGLAPLLSETITRVVKSESVSNLFIDSI
jgi:ribose-phosphate pyrophosphokinase